jgi:hypothetical protein
LFPSRQSAAVSLNGLSPPSSNRCRGFEIMKSARRRSNSGALAHR